MNKKFEQTMIQEYSSEKIALAKKMISSDAFYIIVCDALARKQPLSVVRMNDGERMIMEVSKGKVPSHFLTDDNWLKEYGLFRADLVKVGEDLFTAANTADYFAQFISGFFLPNFDVISLINPREIYVDGFYPYLWKNMNRQKELLKYNEGIAVVCRNSKKVAENLSAKYGANIISIEYDSWKDYPNALEQIGKSNAGLVLCSTGASGKNLNVEVSKKYGKVSLDVGS